MSRNSFVNHPGIQMWGRLEWHWGAFEKLGKPDAAVLLFDKVNSKIGLLPTNRHASNGYPFKIKANVRYRMVCANRFCRHHGIKVDRAIAFCNAEIDGDGILVLDLRSTRGVGKG